MVSTIDTDPSHVFLSVSDTVQQLQSAEMATRCRLPALLVLYRARTSPSPAAVDRARAELARRPRHQHGRHFVQVVVPEQVNPMIDRFLALTLGQREAVT